MTTPEKKRVLINYTGRMGGGAQCALETTKALLKENVNVVAVISNYNEELDEWKKLNLEELICIPTYRNKFEFIVNTVFWNFKYGKKIKKVNQNYEIDAIYCPMHTFWSRNINRFVKAKKLIVVNHDPVEHSGDVYKKWTKMFRTKQIYIEATEIFVHSKKFVKCVEDMYDKKGKVFYVPHGPLELYGKINNKKKIVEYDKDKVNFLFFGTFSKYKGIQILGKAFTKLSSKCDNITLTLAGSGDFKEYEDIYQGLENVNIINRWIADEEVESLFIGENIIAVLPYLDATQSGVIPVAYKYGVPVIATNVGGLDEQIEDGYTGVLIPPNDVDELEKAMLDIVSDWEKYLRIKKNMLEEYKHMGWHSIADKIIELIS